MTPDSDTTLHPELTWSRAWRSASREFWSVQEPSGHFSTSAGEVLAEKLCEVVRSSDARLGHPGSFTVVDLGAGDGGLLAAIRDRCPEMQERARWIGVDVRAISRPGVEGRITELPGDVLETPILGVVMAHEWLDEIPCDVIERDRHGRDRLVLVQGDTEVLGPALSDSMACEALGVDADAVSSWLARWWPLREPGDRAEIGIPRDAAWQWMTGLLGRGVALATDYGHVRAERLTTHRRGTLRAYRHGRVRPPVADGSVGITADVSVDSCRAAVAGTTLTRQRTELDGLSAAAAISSPAALERYFEVIRLRHSAGLGRFHWLRWEAW